MSEHEHGSTQLSEAGRARRDAILERATGELIATHTRRRRRRIISAACAWFLVIAGCTAAAISVGSNARIAEQRDRHELVQSPAPALGDVESSAHGPTDADQSRPEHPAVRIVHVQTDDTASDRYAVNTPFHIDRMDDETLLAVLASMDRPAGLIYIEGRARLTRDVTDDAPPF